MQITKAKKDSQCLFPLLGSALKKAVADKYFISSFCDNILSTNNYIAKLLLEKSFAQHFCTQKLFVKCW
jgi:hypothetical protein